MGQEAALPIVCAGGLDRSKNPHQMYAFPGAAIELRNFEPSIQGGYRRINGYVPFGQTSVTEPSVYGRGVYGSSLYSWVPPAATEVLGVYGYATGLIRVQGTGIYFATDGYNWSLLNATARNNSKRYVTVKYEGDSSNYIYGSLYMADGTNPIAKVTISDPSSPSGSYSTLGSSTGAPQDAYLLEIHKDRLFAVGTAEPNVLKWSGRFFPGDFTLSSAGLIELTDNIVGMKSFRERLFIFCKNSIHVLENIDNPAQLSVLPITKNLGCLCGFTIQEVGGDIVFLSHDGIRMLGATERIGDVAISAISGNIQHLMPAILSAVQSNCLNSLVIRNKNQYRLFYPRSGQPRERQNGIIGVLKQTEAGMGWEWAETRGIESTACCSYIDENRNERVVFGDFSGYVWEMEVGPTFNGTPIEAVFRTPYMNFQDSSMFKTIHYLRVPLHVEGAIPEDSVFVATRYDFEDRDVHQPGDVSFGGYNTEATYGAATYGSNKYGAYNLVPERVLQEGSGHTVSWKFYTNANIRTAPFTINGFTIVFTVGKRL
jgi:hypothetical protein